MIDQNKHKDLFIYLILSVLFAITIQQFAFYKGNSLHLLYAIKDFEFNKLQYDWIANQTNHLPLFTYFNNIILKIFPVNFLHSVHFILLSSCALFLFLICKYIFEDLNKISLSLLWFSLFMFVYHEHSLFGGVAGQDVINEGYQPASYGVLFFIGIYLYLIKKNSYAIFFICLSASFHPSYVLHSGFLIIGILGYFFFQKEYKKFLKILVLYSVLILPITIYVIYNFLLLDNEIILKGQNILLERIPHHASIENWFSYKDLISILVYIVSIILVYKNKRIFIPLSIFGFFSISLTLIQFLTEIDSLALSFPWRASVFLMPLSIMIIISYFLKKFLTNKSNLNLLSSFVFIFIWSFFLINNHFLKDANKDFYKELELTEKININYKSINRLLIPVNLMNIRMNTGLPIFVDWKHHAFKYNEIIIWKQRLDLVQKFYKTKNYDFQKLNLIEIMKIEKISHILIEKDKLTKNCVNLINDDIYALIEVKECY